MSEKLYEYIANIEDRPIETVYNPMQDAAIDETWKYIMPLSLSRTAVKKLCLICPMFLIY